MLSKCQRPRIPFSTCPSPLEQNSLLFHNTLIPNLRSLRQLTLMLSSQPTSMIQCSPKTATISDATPSKTLPKNIQSMYGKWRLLCCLFSGLSNDFVRDLCKKSRDLTTHFAIFASALEFFFANSAVAKADVEKDFL